MLVIMMILLTIDSDCRTFDVNDTGRISESKFRQILATKQVPKDDVDGILEGEQKLSPPATWLDWLKIFASEYRKLSPPHDCLKIVASEYIKLFPPHDCLKIFSSEYRKLDVGPNDTSSVDGSEEQILYKGKDCVQECSVISDDNNL